MSGAKAVVRPEDLPEFSEDLAHCNACEWPDADTAYVPPFDDAWTGLEAIRRDRLNSGLMQPLCAYLKRTCSRCRFEWAERLVGQ